MTKEEHQKIHDELHGELDTLVADFINCTGKLPTKTTIMELIKWSYGQIKNPDESKR